MAAYLQYWRYPYSLDDRDRLRHTASDQFGKVQPGDTIWVVTILEGRLLLVGPIVAGQIVGQREARRLLSYEPWSARYHVIARRGTLSTGAEIDITSSARKLRLVGSVDRLPPRYWGRSLQTLRVLSPGSARLLQDLWKPHGGVAKPVGHVVVNRREEAAVASRIGAGFGSPAENRRVEELAIQTAQRYLKRRGWQVKSVERQKLGYDLECERGKAQIHVEVKGVRGVGTAFILTAGEYGRAATDPNFRLCVVENALSAANVDLLDPLALRKRLTVTPLAYKASLATRRTPNHSMQPARLARG